MPCRTAATVRLAATGWVTVQRKPSLSGWIRLLGVAVLASCADPIAEDALETRGLGQVTTLAASADTYVSWWSPNTWQGTADPTVLRVGGSDRDRTPRGIHHPTRHLVDRAGFQ